MAAGRPTRGRQVWVAVVGALGHDHVFWPMMVGAAAFLRGPGQWPSPWLWLAFVMVTGPLLSVGLWVRGQRRSVTSARG